MASRKRSKGLPVNPRQSAAEAGLRYVTGEGPRISRKRAGKGFFYVGVDGQPLRDKEQLARIRSLVIPPAWEKVWICPSPIGHIQAIGYDAKGRKQYRYHARYREIRNETKFRRMGEFSRALPGIRKRVNADLAKPGLPREKVLATVVRLLETTFIRIGNVEYARANESFGLTTLRNRHVHLEGGALKFHFRGKSGQDHEIEVHDRRVARIVRQCQDLPGYELFQYLDHEGQRHAVDSSDVNAYLKEITGADFTAKDFRTWAGTVQSALELANLGEFQSEAECKRKMLEAIKYTAHRLGNKPATCRKYYIHPSVLEAYADGTLLQYVKPPAEEFTPTDISLHPEELCVIRLIEARAQARAESILAA